ncbi:MAG: hypothetical protein L3J35_12205 [Bacteroidales bacterium]|nr:hypothetical protein [Bacteroidales bacterium]
MNKVYKRFYQILSLGSLTIASCQMKYGMPADIDYYKAVKTQTETNVPIKGLSVSLIHNSDTLAAKYTNEEGVVSFDFEFYDDDSSKVLIEDIDSEENFGKFQTKTVTLTEPDTTIVIMK